MASFQPADNLRSQTFIGLLIAQFLAAFNDQAIHASAMFFAINQGTLREAQAISLMPILFYAPWAIFCTLAGYLADRYSKRNSLIVWKFAEVVITLIALLGFWLGTQKVYAGAWIVLSTVFLMGMHSAFFVPAKYGVMPEILQSRLLSRGNGLLESLSFLAIILGTVFGGVLSSHFHGREYVIGIILTILAVIGAGASLLIQRMPAANPQRPFPPYLYQPLYNNIRALLRSRPLAFAVVGIAFFTFIVAFMRATVYMHGESQVPRWDEEKTSLIVGMVALGIGLGSPLVGFLSGGKVEVGLVPIGALGMILATSVAATVLGFLPGLIVCIILIGFFTGFYIVPLFTLLQHRAPKVSKGDSIATSNFINVTGAIVASLVFFGIDWTARKTGFARELDQRDIIEGKLAADPRIKDGRPVEVVIDGRRTFQAPAIDVDDDTLEVPREVLKKGDVVIVSSRQSGEKRKLLLRRVAPTRPSGKYEYPEGTLAEDPVFKDGELVKVVIESFHIPVRARAREGRRPEDIEMDDDDLDPFKESIKKGSEVIVSVYSTGSKPEDVRHQYVREKGSPQRPQFDKRRLPSLLFLSAGAMTLVTLLILWGQLPDLFYRTVLWFRWRSRARLEVLGLHHLPDNGPVVVVTTEGNGEGNLQVLCSIDRTTLLLEPIPGQADWSGLRLKGLQGIQRGLVVLLSLDGQAGEVSELLYEELTKAQQAPIVPVHREIKPRPEGSKGAQTVYIVVGAPLPAGATLDTVRQESQKLTEEFKAQLANGLPAAEAFVGAH